MGSTALKVKSGMACWDFQAACHEWTILGALTNVSGVAKRARVRLKLRSDRKDNPAC